MKFQLYADTLSWDSDAVGVDPDHPKVPEWKRKEMIYNQAQHYFDKGKVRLWDFWINFYMPSLVYSRNYSEDYFIWWQNNLTMDSSCGCWVHRVIDWGIIEAWVRWRHFTINPHSPPISLLSIQPNTVRTLTHITLRPVLFWEFKNFYDNIIIMCVK